MPMKIVNTGSKPYRNLCGFAHVLWVGRSMRAAARYFYVSQRHKRAVCAASNHSGGDADLHRQRIDCGRVCTAKAA